MRHVVVSAGACGPLCHLSALREFSSSAKPRLLLDRQLNAAARAVGHSFRALRPSSPGLAVDLSGEQHFLCALHAVTFESCPAFALEGAGSVGADSMNVASCCVACALVDVLTGGAQARVPAAAGAGEGPVSVGARCMRIAVVAAC